MLKYWYQLAVEMHHNSTAASMLKLCMQVLIVISLYVAENHKINIHTHD